MIPNLRLEGVVEKLNFVNGTAFSRLGSVGLKSSEFKIEKSDDLTTHNPSLFHLSDESRTFSIKQLHLSKI